ncbi:MAG: hypothetical protein BMS9Abin13_202 [Patescibacteria group bacterium]|nr:MAG: hypothetical protein BMS9Abin13_202 [Patescibacteria group bacterium]
MQPHESIVQDTRNLSSELDQQIHEECPRFSFPALLLRAGGQNEQLRMKLLEFVDVFPALHTGNEIKEHFLAYVRDIPPPRPILLRIAVGVMRIPFGGYVIAKCARKAIEILAQHFIIKDGPFFKRIQDRYAREGATTVSDHLGELVVSEVEAKSMLKKYVHAMEQWGRKGQQFHIAIKFSALFPYFCPENQEESKRRVKDAFGIILEKAQETNSFVWVDAEHHHIQSLVEEIFLETICEHRFYSFTSVGIALQAYLKDSSRRVERMVRIARGRKNPFSVRLVKGAYWDTEVARALQRGWAIPVFRKKNLTDKNFNALLYFLLAHQKFIHVVPATHNPSNIAFAYCAAKKFGVVGKENFEFQILYGLGEPIRRVMLKRGFPVRVYMPIGDLVTGMSYFARRIIENTSNEGFLWQLMGKEKGGLS